MKIVIQIALALVASNSPGIAGEVSESFGSVPNALAQGYQFMGGSGLGPEQTRLVPTTSSAPFSYGEAKYRDGYLYLLKEKDLLICSYSVVKSNPAVTAPDTARPASECFRIK